MDINLDNIAKDLYGKIQTRFQDIKIGDEHAAPLSRKEDIPKARFFEFEYVEGGESLGSISINLGVVDDQVGIVVQVSGDLVDDDNETTHHGAYKFIRSFRKFARDRLLSYKVDNIGKSNLDKRDYMFQAKRKEEPVMPMQPVMESKLYGNSRMSYQDLGEARLIIKHTQPVNIDLPAGRTMHIESIYIENAEGERFKYPFKHLSGARALAEHIKAGGIPYDSIGKHIVSLSEELAGLRKFKGYVMRQTQISEAMGTVTMRVAERIESIKKELHNLQKTNYYSQFAESFEETEQEQIPESVVNDLVDRLTIRTFNEELKSVFPYIYKFVNEGDLPVTELSVDDLLDEDQVEDSKQENGYTESFAPELEFESFMDSIVNEDKDEIFSPNKSAKLRAIDKLNKILEKELQGGPGGINAVESLKGLIDDPDFINGLTDLDPNLDVRPVIQQWLIANKDKFPGNAAETLALIHFGGEGETTPQPEAEVEAPAPAPEVPPAEPAAVPPASEIPPAAPEEIPPAPATPAPAAPMAESIMNALRKAKAAGATLETALDFGYGVKTIAEIIDECGCDPQSVGFSDEEGSEPQEAGIPAMLKYISGFYNKEGNDQLSEGNFTIGGTRMKIKLKKAWEEGEFGDCPASDLIKVFKLIDAKDPSTEPQDQEQSHILKLAGVQRSAPEPEVHHDDKASGLENMLKGIKVSFAESKSSADQIKDLMKKINFGK